jgi:hypothetical protein
MLVQYKYPAPTSTANPSGSFLPSSRMTFKSEPSEFTDNTRPAPRSKKKRRPNAALAFFGSRVCFETIVLMCELLSVIRAGWFACGCHSCSQAAPRESPERVRGIEAQILEQGHRPGHWGLPGWRERGEEFGGFLQLRSDGKAGTEVELRIPAAITYTIPPRDSDWSTQGLRGDHEAAFLSIVAKGRPFNVLARRGPREAPGGGLFA